MRYQNHSHLMLTALSEFVQPNHRNLRLNDMLAAEIGKWMAIGENVVDSFCANSVVESYNLFAEYEILFF